MKKRRNNHLNMKKKFDKFSFNINRVSYFQIAQEGIDKGFITFSPYARMNYRKNVKVFLEYYKNKYDNAFARNFEQISDIHIIKSKDELINKIRSVVINKDCSRVFILYRILNKKKQFVRIGSTCNINQRLITYLQNSFSRISKGITNLHLDIRDLENRDKFNDEFEYHILCVKSSEEKILNLERLFTLYENRYENEVGYDLSVNNYYNKIVGNLFSYINGEFRDKLHPNWKDVPPDKLVTAYKEFISWDEILSRFPNINSAETIKSKAVSYGFSLKGTGSIRDTIAYFIKPVIEEAVKKKLNRNEIIRILIYRGFSFLKKLSTHPEARNKWLYRIINFIWNNEMCKIGYNTATLTRVRWLVIINEALKLAKNPKFNHIGKAQNELIRQGICLKSPDPPHYEGELRHIFKKVKMSYMQKQNKILAPILANYLKQNDPQLSASDIATLFGLDRVNGKKIITKIIYRIFKKFVQGQENIGKIRQYLRKHENSEFY